MRERDREREREREKERDFPLDVIRPWESMLILDVSTYMNTRKL